MNCSAPTSRSGCSAPCSGVIAAIVAHRVFVRHRLGPPRVPYQLAVCSALGLVVAVIVWLAGTGPFA